MGRILAIDYGSRRCGLAWTDPLRLIATPLAGCTQPELAQRIAKLVPDGVEVLLIGWPTTLSGQATHSTAAVAQLAEALRAQYPSLQVQLWDERFTSTLAQRALIEGGASRKKRQDKTLLDSLSAVILLQHYLDYLARPT